MRESTVVVFHYLVKTKSRIEELKKGIAYHPPEAINDQTALPPSTVIIPGRRSGGTVLRSCSIQMQVLWDMRSLQSWRRSRFRAFVMLVKHWQWRGSRNGKSFSRMRSTVVDKQSQPIWYVSSKAIFWQSFFRILFRSTKYVEKHISEVFPMSRLDQPNFWWYCKYLSGVDSWPSSPPLSLSLNGNITNYVYHVWICFLIDNENKVPGLLNG